MNLLTIENLSVSYDGFFALENACLTIGQSDFIGITGPNGGGKTSLIKAIIGEVSYGGTITYSPLLMKNGKISIGYLPQQNAFDRSFPISVHEMVISGLQVNKGMWGRYSKSDRRKADSMLDMVGIESIAKRNINEISEGQLQRSLLCRAIISDPKLLILDEPANFVDNRFEKELYHILQKLNDRMAIVMVSHDLGAISGVVKEIVCVNRHIHRHGSNVITAEQLEDYDSYPRKSNP